MDGHLAQDWETDLLRFLKRNGAKLGPTEVAGKFDGYSEAWTKDSFHMTSLKELMDKVRDFDA